MTNDKAIVWVQDVGKGDIALVGGKGANLGEMTQAQIPVPPGFIVTAQAYFDFVAAARTAVRRGAGGLFAQRGGGGHGGAARPGLRALVVGARSHLLSS